MTANTNIFRKYFRKYFLGETVLAYTYRYHSEDSVHDSSSDGSIYRLGNTSRLKNTR